MECFRDNEWDLNQFRGNGQEFEYFSENSKLKQLVLEWPGVDMVLVQQRWISPGRSLLTETINMVQCYALPAGQLEPNQGLTFLMRSSPRSRQHSISA